MAYFHCLKTSSSSTSVISLHFCGAWFSWTHPWWGLTDLARWDSLWTAVQSGPASRLAGGQGWPWGWRAWWKSSRLLRRQAARCRCCLCPGFIFVCTFLSKKENVHLFSSSFPGFDKGHATLRIFPRTEQTFASARSLGVISWASFWRGKWPFLALGGRPQPLSKSPLKVKSDILRENECPKDPNTPELSKSAKETGNICDRQWHLLRRG